MKFNNKNGTAIVLMIIGMLLLLKFIGWGISGLFSLFLPIVVIGLGILGIKNGKSFIGIILVLIGAISLIAKLASWLAPVLAIVLIVYGCSMMFGRRAH